MKKIFLFISTIFFVLTSFPQEIMPGYPEVLRNFFSKYAGSIEVEDFVNFAKKKDGWFVQKLNRLKNDSLLSEMKFWSVQKNSYLSMDEEFQTQDSKVEIEKSVKYYLEGDGPYKWNDYERCRYHGYNGWEDDIINDFGNQSLLADTLLESLGRAYSSLCNTYLWYQQGGRRDGKDTMQIILKRLQMPSTERINKVNFLITKSIETFDRLLKQNPSYNTSIGNIYLKKFNECMNGYMQMSLAMQDEKAIIYINKALLEASYVQQAKNYLNSCDKNAVLFTYGDNDTYQLWYVQEKENYRRDVTVINTFMLGLPVYIDLLKKKNAVSFSASPSFYESAGADISYFKDGEGTAKNKQLNLVDYLKNIYSKNENVEYPGLNGEPQTNSTYSIKKINLSINTAAFNKISVFKTMVNNISFELKDYLYINDLIEFDIINENINKRPVYFTTADPGYFDSSLVQQGIVYRLFPLNNTTRTAILKKEIRMLEKFADSIYRPVISFKANAAENISPDGNNVFFQLYSRIADYYIDFGDINKATLWLDKAYEIFPVIKKGNMPAGYFFANSYQKIDKKKSQQYFEMYGEYIFDKYNRPTAIKGYLSKEDCLHILNSLHHYFQQAEIQTSSLDSLIKNIEAD